MKIRVNVVFAILVVLWSSEAAYGISSARLSVTVTDTSGAFLREAPIQIESLNTAFKKIGKTNATGLFALDLPSGDYRFSLEMKGFAPLQEIVHLKEGQSFTRTFILKVAGPSMTTSVSIPSEAPGILPVSRVTAGFLGLQDRLDQPFLITGYSAAGAERRASSTVGDSLGGDASITLATGSQKNSPFFEMIYSRGLPMNNYTGVAVDGLYGLGGTLPLTDPIGTVEHIAGPTTFLNGAPGNVGGALNLIPKRAEQRQLKLTPEYTSATVKGIHGDASSRFGRIDQWGLRANSMYRAGDTSIVSNSLWQTASSLDADLRSKHFNGTFDLQHDRTLNRGYSLYEGFASGVAPTRAPSGSLSSQLPWMEAWDRDIRVLGRARYTPNDKVEIFAAGGHTDSRFEYGGYCQATILSASGDASCLPIQAGNFGSIWSLEAGGRVTIRTGPVIHHGYAGFDRISYPTKTYGTLVLTNSPIFFNVYSKDRPSRSLLRVNRPATYLTAYQRTSSVVLADTLTFFQQRLTATIGGRYVAPTARSYSSNGLLTADTHAAQWSPGVAAAFRVYSGLAIYGNVVQALEPAGSPPATAANAYAVFPPLESRQEEVGLKARYQHLNAEFAAFRIRKANQYLEPATNLYTQNGVQLNRGFDGRIWSQISQTGSFQVSASYIDAEMQKTAGGAFDGKKAPAAPHASVHAVAENTVPWTQRTLLVGLSLDAVSGTPYENSNARQLPAWWKLSPLLRYEAGKNEAFVLQLLIENVTGQNYWIGGGNGLVSIGGARSYEFRISKTLR